MVGECRSFWEVRIVWRAGLRLTKRIWENEEEEVVEVNWTLGREAVVVVEDRDEGSLLYEEEVLVVEVVSTSLLSDPR